MPPPERMLATLRKAHERVLDTPGRAGHLIRLAGCSDVLVVGDLHGHVGNFQAAWKLADLANRPGRHLVLQELVHGPFNYPAGGEKSHQLVDLFAAVKCQFPARVHYIPGNHEMGQWTGRPIQKGSSDLNAEFRRGVSTAYGAAADDIYAAYVALFQTCPLALRTPNRVFISHTLVPGKQLDAFDPSKLEQDEYAPADLQPGGVVYGMQWGRDTSPNAVAQFLAMVDADLLVTGHLPADDGFVIPNDRQVALDCSGTPGGYAVVPADRPLTHAELVAGVGVV